MARMYPSKPYFDATHNPFKISEVLAMSLLLTMCVALFSLLGCMITLKSSDDLVIWIMLGVPFSTFVVSMIGLKTFHLPINLFRYMKYKKKIKAINTRIAKLDLKYDREDSLHFAKLLNKKVM